MTRNHGRQNKQMELGQGRQKARLRAWVEKFGGVIPTASVSFLVLSKILEPFGESLLLDSLSRYANSIAQNRRSISKRM